MFPRPLFALPLLLLPVLTRAAHAQPPRAPSAVGNNPTNWNVAVPVPIPDPPPITPEELQTLTGGPTLVTFQGTDVPVDDAVKTLLEAAKLPANRFGNQFGDKKIPSVDWQQTPFWTAAAQIEAASGGSWDGRFGRGLSLMNFGQSEASGLDGAVAARTPLVTLIANSLARTSTNTALFGPKAAPPRSESVQMRLTAYFDPKLQVQSCEIRAPKFQKQGEAVPVVVPVQNFGFRGGFNGNGNGTVSQLQLPFPVGTAPATKFSGISGVLHCEIAAATQAFAVPDVIATPNAEITIAGTQYRLQSATLDEGQLTVKVRIAAGANERNFYNRNAFASLKLHDAQNRELSANRSSYGGTTGEFTFNLQTRNGGDNAVAPGPYSLDWPIVTSVKSLDIPFELRDVTVP